MKQETSSREKDSETELQVPISTDVTTSMSKRICLSMLS